MTVKNFLNIKKQSKKIAIKYHNIDIIVAILAIIASSALWITLSNTNFTFIIIVNLITLISTILLITHIIKTYEHKVLVIISDKIYNEFNQLNYNVVYLSPKLYEKLKWANNIKHKFYVIDKSLKKYEYSYTKKTEFLTKIDELYD